MVDTIRQRDTHTTEADSYISASASAYASQVRDYGFSYYWWYYGIPTGNCHALAKST